MTHGSIRRSQRFAAEEAAIGILDSILGTNTSAGTQGAAETAIGGIIDGQTSGNHALRNYTGQANDALTSNFAPSLDALHSGYGSAIDALSSYGTAAQGQLANGVRDATSTVLGGNTAYAPYLAGGQSATTMLGNSLGLNGSAGNDAATAAFRASPGYQFQVNQSTGAAERAAAAAGGLGSGSVLDAITRLGSHLADTEYSNWQSNLQGLGTQGLNAANSISANNQTAGGYQYGGGTAGAQLTQNTGQNIGQAHANEGTGTSTLYSNFGTGLSSNLTGLGQGISANDTNAAVNEGNLTMQAGQAADAATNTNNGILSKLIGSVAGLPFGGTSLSTPTAGGFSVTPGANGSFSFAPAAAASSGGSGIFGPMIANAGKSLANVVKY